MRGAGVGTSKVLGKKQLGATAEKEYLGCKSKEICWKYIA